MTDELRCTTCDYDVAASTASYEDAIKALEAERDKWKARAECTHEVGHSKGVGQSWFEGCALCKSRLVSDESGVRVVWDD